VAEQVEGERLVGLLLAVALDCDGDGLGSLAWGEGLRAGLGEVVLAGRSRAGRRAAGPCGENHALYQSPMRLSVTGTLPWALNRSARSGATLFSTVLSLTASVPKAPLKRLPPAYPAELPDRVLSWIVTVPRSL